MAKIPIILEPGRADGKLIKTNSVYDDNQEKFLSDKIKEIDDNHNTLNDTVNSLTDTVNNNEIDIENKLEIEKNRATNVENNLRETINNITKISGSSTTANIVTIDTIPNTSASNVQQALNELFNTDEELNNAIIEEKERAEVAEQTIMYDVSARNNGAVFESLQAILNSSNLNTLIPTSVRHGGMTIKFIQSSNNKYVQYRLTNQNWSVDVNDWTSGSSGKFSTGEKVSEVGIDAEPTAESDNLVKSRGVKNVIEQINQYVKKDSIFGEFFVSSNSISENYYWQITDSTTFNKFITKIEWPNPTSSSIDNAFIVLKDNGENFIVDRILNITIPQGATSIDLNIKINTDEYLSILVKGSMAIKRSSPGFDRHYISLQEAFVGAVTTAVGSTNMNFSIKITYSEGFYYDIIKLNNSVNSLENKQNSLENIISQSGTFGNIFSSKRIVSPENYWAITKPDSLHTLQITKIETKNAPSDVIENAFLVAYLDNDVYKVKEILDIPFPSNSTTVNVSIKLNPNEILCCKGELGFYYDTQNHSVYYINAYCISINKVSRGAVLINLGMYHFSIKYDFNYGIESDLKVLENKQDDIIAKSLVWKNKKWACVGDSLTEVNIRTLKNYHSYISDATGINVVNLGIGGSGYSSGGSNAFVNRINTIPSDSDLITIFGSGNDIEYILKPGIKQLGNITDTISDNTICGDMNAVFDYIQEHYPIIPLGVITPTPWKDYEPSDNGNLFIDYCQKLIEICVHRGIPYLDLYHCSNLHPNDAAFRELVYSRDDGIFVGVHPNEIGHKLISPRFANFISTLLMGYHSF